MSRRGNARGARTSIVPTGGASMWALIVAVLFLILLASNCSVAKTAPGAGDATSARAVPPSSDFAGHDSAPVPATVCSGLGAPWAVCLDRRGNLYVADAAGGRVLMVMPDGVRVPVAGNLDRPAALAVDLKGRVLVAEAGTGRILRLERGGEVRVVADGLAEPRGLAVDRDGGVMVACAKGGVVRLDRKALR